MKANELTGTKAWEKVRPLLKKKFNKLGKQYSASSTGKWTPGFTLVENLGNGKDLGFEGHEIIVDLSCVINQTRDKFVASATLNVSGKTIRYTMDGPIENDEWTILFNKSIPLESTEEEILAMAEHLAQSIPSAVSKFNAVINELKNNSKAK